MRATEALYLSNPSVELTEENKDLCTHVSWEREKDAILAARRKNRQKPRDKGLFDDRP
jgi:hypothetical protein